MKVVWAKEFGGAEVLTPGDAPEPTPGRGQVVVDVAVADTLFLDIVIRRGTPGPWTVRTPYVPGFGVGGQVSAVGEGVDQDWLGKTVVARSGNYGPGDDESVATASAGFAPTNGYAQRAVIPEAGLFTVPSGLDLREAVALINDGLTAMQVFEAARVNPGERVFVTPAAGGLGNLLVQLASQAGAHVVAGAGASRKLEAVREAGAAATVDYSADGWTDHVLAATDGKGPDVVLDGVGGAIGRASFGLTANGGRFFAFGSPSGEFTAADPAKATARGITVTGLMQLPFVSGDERRLPELALAAAAAGRIRPLIGQTYPLSEAAEAHRAMEAREVLGKTLLLV